MKIKFLLWGVVSILIISLAAGAYWWMSRPQVITFSDDAKLTLVKAEYGKRHAPPTVKAAAKPAAAAPVRRGGASSFTTPTDTLVLWVRQEYDASGNQYHNFQYYVYDEAETACVQTFGRNYVGNNRGSNEVVAVQFDAFPRRQGKLHVRVQEQGNGGQELSEQKFVVSNPVRNSFAKWTAETLPSTKEDGDLAVTLTKLVAGADMPYQRNSDNPDDAMNKGVQVVFHVERAGKRGTNWTPVSVETTDATGNRTAINYGPNSGNQVQWNGDEGTFTYQYGLWPDEPAWKLRMEMTQSSDFSNDEQWTAQNIPVVLGSQQSVNAIAGVRGGMVVRGGVVVRNNPGTPAEAPAPFAEADIGGHHIKVFPVVQFTNGPARPAGLPANAVFNQQQQTMLMVQIQPAVMNNGMINAMIINNPNGTQRTDDGMRVTLAKVTDGQGNEITAMNGGMSTSGMGNTNSTSTLRFNLGDIAGVTNINATIALHKNRFFDFTAKPSKLETNNKN